MADQQAEEAKKKGGLVKIIGLILGGLLLVAVGLGAGYFMFGGNSPTPSAEIEQIIERKLKESGQLPENDAEEVEGEEPALNKKETPAVDTFITSYFEFEGNFTSNLKDSRKFLQLGVGISTQYDETVIENVELHQLALRSEILGTVSDFTEEEIKGKSGRDALAARLVEAINAKLEILEGFGGIDSVHFTSFVLQ